MGLVYIPPTFRRDGVVAGFVLRRAFTIETVTQVRDGVGVDGEPVSEEIEVEVHVPSLTAVISKGVLFAQGLMYRPGAAPALPAMTANARRNLYYNSITGFYWATAAGAGDDAFLGWALSDGAGIVALSSRRLGAGTETLADLSGGVVAPDHTAPAVTGETAAVAVTADDYLVTGQFDTPDSTHLVMVRVRVVDHTTQLAVAPDKVINAPFDTPHQAYALPPIARGGTAPTWDVLFLSVNEDGQIGGTARVNGLTPDVPAESSITAAETGSRYLDSDGAVCFAVSYTPVAAHAVYPLPITVWANVAGGTKVWRGQFTMLAAGALTLGAQGTSSEATLFPPTTADESWEVTFAAGWFDEHAAVPASAKTSAGFTVARIAAPGSTDGTAAYVDAVSYSDGPVGASMFGWPHIYLTLPAWWRDSEKFFYARLYVQTGAGTGGGFVAGGAHPGDTEHLHGTSLGDWVSDDSHGEGFYRVSGSDRIYCANPNLWNVPNDSNTTHRFVWAIASRRDAGTGATEVVQNAWSSGVGVSTAGTAAFQDLVLDGTKSRGKGHQLAAGTFGSYLKGGSGVNPYVSTSGALGDDGSGNLRVNVGAGVTVSLGNLVAALGSGMAFNGSSQIVPNLGNGLTLSGSQVALNLGSGMQFSSGALTLNLGGGLQISGGALAVNAGGGVQLSAGVVTLNLGGGVQITGGALAANLGNGVQISGGAIVVNLGGGLVFSGSAVAANVDNSTVQVVTTIQVKPGGIGDTQIASVTMSKLNAGTMTVGSGGATFTGTGGITIAGGGSISVLVGSIASNSGYNTGPAGTYSQFNTTVIDGSRNFVGAAVSVAGNCTALGFNPTGYTGATSNIAIYDSGGSPCHVHVNGSDVGAVQLRFVGGVYTGYF